MKSLLKRRKTAEESRARAFKMEYDDLKNRLDCIRTNFDNVSDDPAIDALIFEENAVLCRLSALYRKAREAGVRMEYPDEYPKNSF